MGSWKWAHWIVPEQLPKLRKRRIFPDGDAGGESVFHESTHHGRAIATQRQSIWVARFRLVDERGDPTSSSTKVLVRYMADAPEAMKVQLDVCCVAPNCTNM